ncbi:hypothetical protein [Pediococcus pentosaceus]|uniref:hypothetical protein n=1 Tax=Pediococcus pentosaceus TaxID=1255 RepID=UPI0040360076
MKNKVLIIAAFPAMGKTYFTEHNSRYTKQILDSDSSLFSWNYNHKGNGRNRNLDFPYNYLDYIAYMYKSLQEYPVMELEGLSQVSGIIFTSTHSDVLKGLKKYGLPFTAVIPNSKSVLMERLNARNDHMTDMLDANYDKFTNDVKVNAGSVIISSSTISGLVYNGEFF